MKRLFIIIIVALLVAVPAMAQQGPLAPDTPEGDGEQEQFSRVQVNVVVTDASGAPLPRLMVVAQSVSLGVSQSLTDKDGKCGMTLRPGDWVIKVSRNLDVLLRLEIEVGESESLDLPLTIGAVDQADSGSTDRVGDDLLAPRINESDRTARISAGSLNRTGAQAAAELALFTDPVLLEARQKILDQYAANKYSTSYWMEHNVRESGSSGSARDYRLDWDWQGNVVGAGGSSSGSRPTVSLFGTSSALMNVPVNVNIEVATDRVNEYRGMYDFGNTGSGAQNTANPNSLVNKLSERVGGFLTGGSESPESRRGFDFGARAELSAQSGNSFRAFYNEINNHIINLYRPLRDAYNQAVGTTAAIRGVEFVVEKTFNVGLSAKVFYSYSEGGGLNIRTVDLYFEDWQDFETFLEQGLRRDVSTTLEARFSETGTRLAANYRMFISDLEDVGFSDRVSDLVSEHSRINLSLNQKMNFGFLSSARISFSFAVNNLLNQTRNTFLSPDALEEDLNARKYLGGIRIEF